MRLYPIPVLVSILGLTAFPLFATILKMIVDFHTHVFPPRMREQRELYLKEDPLFRLLYSNPRARLATAEELIASMEESGVSVSVILGGGWVSHRLCVETNDYILEAVSRYGGRLVGFCGVQPLAGEAALAEVERCARGGARGIGELTPDVQGFDLGGEVMVPLVEAAKKYGLILLTHASEPVGHLYPGKGKVTPEVLYRFISRFPEQPLVCAHWGGGLPFYALMPEVAQALKNTFFDTAASPFLYRPEVFRHVAEMVGGGKILFGSDYPLMRQGRFLKYLRPLGLPAELEEMILGGNARRLLGLGV